MNNNFYNPNPLEQRFTELIIKLDCAVSIMTSLNSNFELSPPNGASPEEAKRYRDSSNLAFVASEYINAACTMLERLEDAYLEERKSVQIDIDATVVVTAPANKNQRNYSEKAGV